MCVGLTEILTTQINPLASGQLAGILCFVTTQRDLLACNCALDWGLLG